MRSDNTLYTASATFQNGRWSAQLTDIPAGDYDVWAELDVIGMGCSDSATNTVKVTVAP